MQLTSFLTYVGYYFKRTDKETEKTQFYNDMLVWLSLQIPHGGYKFQSWINSVLQQEDYPLPSTQIHVLHPIRLLEGSASTDSGYPMIKITKEEYDILEPNPNRTSPSTGKPKKYTIFGRSFLTWPIADKSTYIFEVDWVKAITAQSGGTDTHSLGTEYDEILCWGTLERLFESIELYQEAQYWASKYKDHEGKPIGVLEKLIDRERSLEGWNIGQVQNNNL